MAYERELQAALHAARYAGQTVLRYRKQGVTAEVKSDASPVTIADKESEKLIVASLKRAFPEDGFLGEEGEQTVPRNGRRWIIDPIDGTRDFLRGNDFFAVLIGMEEQGEMKVGVAHFPALGRMYYATKGGGAFSDGRRIQASNVQRPEDAMLCVQQMSQVQKHPFAAQWVEWISHFWAVRCFGGILDAMMVAEGSADVWIGPNVSPWDVAAPKIILEEAGARFGDFRGGADIMAPAIFACAPGMWETVHSFVAR
jgi:histidinol-phosphatase